ncbi:MAG: hypothetical protein QM537_01480 [Candidatus Symbiobacter sp.]|nr:hypothetical protein [Candidatus Symbiobacter sp.]
MFMPIYGAALAKIQITAKMTKVTLYIHRPAMTFMRHEIIHAPHRRGRHAARPTGRARRNHGLV